MKLQRTSQYRVQMLLISKYNESHTTSLYDEDQRHRVKRCSPVTLQMTVYCNIL